MSTRRAQHSDERRRPTGVAPGDQRTLLVAGLHQQPAFHRARYSRLKDRGNHLAALLFLLSRLCGILWCPCPLGLSLSLWEEANERGKYEKGVKGLGCRGGKRRGRRTNHDGLVGGAHCLQGKCGRA